jgi:hypothetical protein
MFRQPDRIPTMFRDLTVRWGNGPAARFGDQNVRS